MDANRLRAFAQELRYLSTWAPFVAQDDLRALGDDMERESYITNARGLPTADPAPLRRFHARAARLGDVLVARDETHEWAPCGSTLYLLRIVDAMRDARERAAA